MRSTPILTLTRRRLLGLGALAVASPALAACGSGVDPGPSNDGDDMSLVAADIERAEADPAARAAGAAAVLALVAPLWPALGVSQRRQGGSAAVSPFSVAMALSMATMGAAGATRREMLQVLGASDAADLAAGCNALVQDLESRAGKVPGDPDERSIELAGADQVFGQAGTTWQQPFLDTLARDFGTGVRTVDFQGDPEGAREVVNRWTAAQTRDRIEEIIPAGAFTPDTRMTLVDALYLKAPWATEFEKDRTRDAAFALADGSTAQVPFMAGTVGRSAVADGWSAARIPYAGGRLAMTVVVPRDDDGTAVIEAMADGRLAALLAVDDVPAALRLPRWRFRAQLGLSGPLAAGGMRLAFSDDADFSGMTTDEALRIADVLHEVFIAVDESGTEAAAATAVVMRTTTVEVPPDREIAADRPFLFCVHTDDGVPLFVGWCGDPR